MAQFEIQPDAQRIGETAAAKTVGALNQAIESHGTAVWAPYRPRAPKRQFHGFESLV
jgi:hypothetical protein